MYKKNIKLVLILVGIILIVPITAYAVSNVIEYISKVENTDNIKQELLEEKEQYTNVITEMAKTEKLEIDEELTNKIEGQIEKIAEKEQEIINIINRFYPNEYKELKEQLDSKNINSDNHDVSNTSPEMKFYNLVLDIIENETLTNQELNLLKEFMTSQYSNAEGNKDVQERIERLCM